MYDASTGPAYDWLPVPYLVDSEKRLGDQLRLIDADIAAYESAIRNAGEGEAVAYVPLEKARLSAAHQQVLAADAATTLWYGVGGSLAGTAAHRGQVKQLDRSVPNGMPVPEGFKGYTRAERAIDLTPTTLAEISDAIRLNAAQADASAVVANVPRTSGRFGTNAHGEFERLNVSLNAIVAREGSGFTVRVEEFRDPGGVVTGRRARGSKGVDAVVYYRGIPIAGFDLKTGRPWSARELAEVQRRFGIGVEQIHTR